MTRKEDEAEKKMRPLKLNQLKYLGRYTSLFMAQEFQAAIPLRSFTLVLITGWHCELPKTLHELFLLSIIVCILLPPAFSSVSFLFLLLKAKKVRE